MLNTLGWGYIGKVLVNKHEIGTNYYNSYNRFIGEDFLDDDFFSKFIRLIWTVYYINWLSLSR